MCYTSGHKGAEGHKMLWELTGLTPNSDWGSEVASPSSESWGEEIFSPGRMGGGNSRLRERCLQKHKCEEAWLLESSDSVSLASGI